MQKIEAILGNRLDPALAERLHHVEHHGGIDLVTIEPADIARHRLRVTSGRGRDLAIALPRDQQLFDGAVLHLDTHSAIVLRVAGQHWLRLVPERPEDAVELGYHAGNLHWKVRFEGGTLLVALEAPAADYIARMASQLGGRPFGATVLESLPPCP